MKLPVVSCVALAALLLAGCGSKSTLPVPTGPTPLHDRWVDLDLTRSPSQVYAFASDGSRLVVGGAIHDALGRGALTVVQWDGHAWSAPPAQLGGQVESVALLGGEILAGVSQDPAGLGYLYRLGSSGWQPVGGGVSAPVIAMTPFRSGLACGGLFLQAGDVRASFVAWWDGSDWHNLGGGVNNPVYAMTVFRGDLIVGGRLWSAGGSPAAYIARWDGAAWHSLGEGMDGVVTTLTVHDDALIAGGYFQTAGGVAVHGVARWDGVRWNALGTGLLTTPGEVVFSIVSHGGDLIAGGRFGQNAARWRDGVWTPMPGLSASVEAMTVFQDDLYAGGLFTGDGVNAVARWAE